MDIYAAWFAESASESTDRDPAILGAEGRHISGIRVLDAKEALERPIKRSEIDTILEEIRNTAPGNDGDTLSETVHSVTEILRRIKTSLADLEKLAREGFEAAKKAAENRAANRPFSAELAMMEEIDNSMLSGNGRNLVSFLIQPIILELTSTAKSADPLEDSRRLYEEIANSASFHLEILKPKRRK